MTKASFQILSDREHVLKRPAVYIGSTQEVEEYSYLLKDEKFEYTQIKYIPALLKIINEIIDNSLDEAIRTEFQFANKIQIDMNESSILVRDNGRGIPVKKVQDSQNQEKYIPELCFTTAKSGTNFDDIERKGIGQNGVGSFCTNVFSKYFKCDTSDGYSRFILECKNNLTDVSSKVKPSDKKYTEVYFELDFEKFELQSLPSLYVELVKQRLYFLSMAFPKIEFIFNKQKMKPKTSKVFMQSFSEHFEVIDKEKYFIAVTPNCFDDFKQVSYTNGLFLKNGGNHITLISTEIVNRLRDKIVKKYKDIKPGDIKNKIQLVVFFREFPQTKFDTQSKEFLANTNQEIRDYLGDIDYDSFVQKVFKNDNIVEPIIEVYKIKEEFKKRQDLKNLNSQKKKINSDKYFPATDNNKYLVLTEGDSACGGLSAVLGRKDYGYFALKGKPLNTLEVTTSKLVSNEEFKNLISIMNIDLIDPTKTEPPYENILIATDQDLDGLHIRALLIAFFYKFAPSLLEQKKVQFIKTPMIVARKQGKIIDYFFNFQEYNEYKNKNPKGIDYQYYKGLGTWEKDDLKHIFNTHGLSTFIEPYENDILMKENIEGWLGKTASDFRKDSIKTIPFDIEKA